MTQPNSDFPYWETPVQPDHSEIGRLNQMLVQAPILPAPTHSPVAPGSSMPQVALSGKALTLTIATESARLDITFTPL